MNRFVGYKEKRFITKASARYSAEENVFLFEWIPALNESWFHLDQDCRN